MNSDNGKYSLCGLRLSMSGARRENSVVKMLVVRRRLGKGKLVDDTDATWYESVSVSERNTGERELSEEELSARCL